MTGLRGSTSLEPSQSDANRPGRFPDTWKGSRSGPPGEGISVTIVYEGRGSAYTLDMSLMEHPILIGCSGWSYPDWEGPFYPAGMEAGDYLEWYADRFPIVEVDSTFYRPPTPRMVRGWRDRTPDGLPVRAEGPAGHHPREAAPRLRRGGRRVRLVDRAAGREAVRAPCCRWATSTGGRSARSTSSCRCSTPSSAAWPHRRGAAGRRDPQPALGRPGAGRGPPRPQHGADADRAEVDAHAGGGRRADRPGHRARSAFVRLLGDREAIEKVTTTWDKIVVDRSAELAETRRGHPGAGRAGAGGRLRQQPLRGPLARDRPRAPRPARPARPGPPGAAEDHPVRLIDGGTPMDRDPDEPEHPDCRRRLGRPASATGARKLGRLRLGVEPLEEQLARYRRVTWGLTAVPAVIGADVPGLFAAFGGPDVGVDPRADPARAGRRGRLARLRLLRRRADGLRRGSSREHRIGATAIERGEPRGRAPGLAFEITRRQADPRSLDARLELVVLVEARAAPRTTRRRRRRRPRARPSAACGRCGAAA